MARAGSCRERAAKSGKSGSSKERTIEPGERGEKRISFREGGLHASTGTSAGKKISAKKHEEAREGKLGKKAQKQEMFFENVLKGRGGRKGK
jgi:hypothetical protein